MPASIGGAGIGTGGALHFSGGSGAMSTVIWVAVVLKGLLRIGRLILRTRFGRQGLLRRNLITVFFTVNNPREKFSHPRHPRCCLHGRDAPPSTTNKAPRTRVACSNNNASVEQKPLEIGTLRRCMHVGGRCMHAGAGTGRRRHQRQHNGTATGGEKFSHPDASARGGNADLRKTAHAPRYRSRVC